MSKSLTINTAPMLGTNNVLNSVSDNNPGLRMNAVLYIPQSLSPEQQAQARANIGAAEGDEVPTRVSQLDNDMDYTTQSTVNTLLLPKADLSYVQTIGNDVDTLNSYSVSLGNQIDTTNSNVSDLTSYANTLGNQVDGKADQSDVNNLTSYANSLGNDLDTKASQSDLNSLTSYANSLGQDLDNVYTKNESDNKFEPLYVPEYIEDTTNIL